MYIRRWEDVQYVQFTSCVQGTVFYLGFQNFRKRVKIYAKVIFPLPLLYPAVVELLDVSQISLILSLITCFDLPLCFFYSVFVFLNQFDQRHLKLWEALLAENLQFFYIVLSERPCIVLVCHRRNDCLY